MYKHCTTEESARRQRQIEHCLLELMDTVPYAQITISDICSRVGISRKSFYRYFGSKEGCLYALIDHSIMEFASMYLPDDQSDKLFEHYFNYWKQLSPLLEALCQNRLTSCLFERTLLCVTQEDYELLNLLKSQNGDDGFEQILYMVSGITGVLIHWHVTGYRKTSAQMAQILERLVAHRLPV